MNSISESESLVLISISEFIKENDYSPSVRDIAYDLDKSVSTIHFHLKRLKEKGFIDYKEKVSRTIRIK